MTHCGELEYTLKLPCSTEYSERCNNLYLPVLAETNIFKKLMTFHCHKYFKGSQIRALLYLEGFLFQSYSHNISFTQHTIYFCIRHCDQGTLITIFHLPFYIYYRTQFVCYKHLILLSKIADCGTIIGRLKKTNGCSDKRSRYKYRDTNLYMKKDCDHISISENDNFSDKNYGI